MTAGPPLPLVLPEPDPEYGTVRLRAFEVRDVAMVQDSSTDPLIPLIGSLVADADETEALAYIGRQHRRLVTGEGYSFCIAHRDTDAAVGHIGLWLASIGQGRATAGYSVAPRARGHGYAGQALIALTTFGWTLQGLIRTNQL